MKIRPEGAEMFHADGRTDRYHEVNSCFSQFCESAKIVNGRELMTGNRESCRALGWYS